MKTNHTPHPGSEPLEKDLISDIELMTQTRGEDYIPRTRHLNPDGSAVYTNRLFLETSPYLNQHAHNPVNWYPWGKEAFDKAVSKDRPILVSIGYSTCHWCHVMEEESFEDLEIARYLNQNFIAVKVDREERPDVDSIYMKAVQVMGIHGGWPLNVVLTPDLRPFFGGTYFPPRDGNRGVLSGFLSLLKRIRQVFAEKRSDIETTAQAVTQHVQKISVTDQPGGIPDQTLFLDISAILKNAFDPVNGGVKGAPKFPSSLPVPLLFQIHEQSGDRVLKDMALITLKKMACGGMYDQVGGGFHRYSVDEKWQVPHFEKMLYDNALLAGNYMKAWTLTKEHFYKRVAVEILEYVIRDMTSDTGGFFSATDADSKNDTGDNEEGFYFTWTPSGLDKALGTDLSGMVQKLYGVTSQGNFESRNILTLKYDMPEYARQNHMDSEVLQRDLDRAREILLETRNKRSLPIRDEKIIASWNGLMISAFAKGGKLFNNEQYLKTARQAALFILNHMVIQDRLYRCYKDGMVKTAGFLEDYTFMIQAFLDLYENDDDPFWLEAALKMQSAADELFKDQQNGGYFMTSKDSDLLIAREKPGSDNAIPSGNSIALMNLLRLSVHRPEGAYMINARNLIKVFSKQAALNPMAYTAMLEAIGFYRALS